MLTIDRSSTVTMSRSSGMLRKSLNTRSTRTTRRIGPIGPTAGMKLPTTTTTSNTFHPSRKNPPIVPIRRADSNFSTNSTTKTHRHTLSPTAIHADG